MKVHAHLPRSVRPTGRGARAKAGQAATACGATGMPRASGPSPLTQTTFGNLKAYLPGKSDSNPTLARAKPSLRALRVKH